MNRKRVSFAEALALGAKTVGQTSAAAALLCHVSGLSKTGIYTRGGDLLGPAAFELYEALLAELKTGKPLAYVLKNACFMGFDFYVDENVLIPRPDTETLAETAVSFINENNFTDIVEIGTGSGCVAVSLAKLCPRARVSATDISPSALEIAERNARQNGAEIAFLPGSLFAGFKGKADCVVSNPPYIPAGDIPGLDAGVRDFEPRTALDGGADGLDFYREITRLAPGYLREGGMVIYEIGYDQREAVMRILAGGGFEEIGWKKDLAGRDRIVWGRLR